MYRSILITLQNNEVTYPTTWVILVPTKPAQALVKAAKPEEKGQRKPFLKCLRRWHLVQKNRTRCSTTFLFSDDCGQFADWIFSEYMILMVVEFVPTKNIILSLKGWASFHHFILPTLGPASCHALQKLWHVFFGALQRATLLAHERALVSEIKHLVTDP